MACTKSHIDQAMKQELEFISGIPKMIPQAYEFLSTIVMHTSWAMRVQIRFETQTAGLG